MAEISRFYGIVVSMYFDDHAPPHFHIRYQGYEALVTIEAKIIKGEMPGRAIKLVLEWLELHQEELMQTWDLMQQEGKVQKIEPLS